MAAASGVAPASTYATGPPTKGSIFGQLRQMITVLEKNFTKAMKTQTSLVNKVNRTLVNRTGRLVADVSATADSLSTAITTLMDHEIELAGLREMQRNISDRLDLMLHLAEQQQASHATATAWNYVFLLCHLATVIAVLALVLVRAKSAIPVGPSLAGLPVPRSPLPPVRPRLGVVAEHAERTIKAERTEDGGRSVTEKGATGGSAAVNSGLAARGESPASQQMLVGPSETGTPKNGPQGRPRFCPPAVHEDERQPGPDESRTTGRSEAALLHALPAGSLAADQVRVRDLVPAMVRGCKANPVSRASPGRGFSARQAPSSPRSSRSKGKKNKRSGLAGR